MASVKYIFNFLFGFIFGKFRYRVHYHGNRVKSTHDKLTILASLNDSFDNCRISKIVIQYHDGVLKEFNEYNWHLFGDGILRNCGRIKVIVCKK